MGTEGSDGGVDRISSLPDDLLLSILVGVADTAAAARTSVLSRRWRHVWAHLPELFFHYYYQDRHGQLVSARARAHQRVDAALAAHAGSTTTTAVTLLEVALPRWAPPQAPSGGAEKAAAPPLLLQFASQRVAGELRLSLQYDRLSRPIGDDDGEIVVPPCERATAITLDVAMLPLRFPFHGLLAAAAAGTGTGTFAALAALRITRARVHSRELEDAVSSRCCPRLKELFLKLVALDDEPLVLSILSDSLERLEIVSLTTLTSRLKVVAPKLETLRTPRLLRSGAHIVAPKLLEVWWQGRYDPISDCIMEAGRHLQRLKIGSNISAANLMLRFHTVHELELTVEIREGIQKYQRYLEDVGKLSKCEVLVIRFAVTGHAIKPALLHLLKECSAVKKIVVHYLSWRKDKRGHIPSELQCDPWILGHDEENDIALGLLEHVEIGPLTPVYHKVEFVRLLCQYSATFQNRVTVTLIENNHKKYIQEELQSICVSNDKLVIKVQPTQAARGLKGFAALKR